MKRSRIILVMLAMLVGLSLGAWAQADSSLQDILNKGTLVLGLDASFPPMGFTDPDSGDIVGFDIDLAREVASRLGVELVCQPIDWYAKEMELNAHHIDVIWNGMTITPQRLADMRISLPYLKNDQVVVVRTADGITNLTGLAGKKLGLQAGSSANDALDAAADFKASLGEVVPFDENLTALMDLHRGGVDAVLVDVIVANYYMTVNDYPFLVLDESLAPEEYGIGFRKNDNTFADKVNEILLEMRQDGILEKISDDWFGTDITIIGKVDPPA